MGKGGGVGMEKAVVAWECWEGRVGHELQCHAKVLLFIHAGRRSSVGEAACSAPPHAAMPCQSPSPCPPVLSCPCLSVFSSSAGMPQSPILSPKAAKSARAHACLFVLWEKWAKVKSKT